VLTCGHGIAGVSSLAFAVPRVNSYQGDLRDGTCPEQVMAFGVEGEYRCVGVDYQGVPREVRGRWDVGFRGLA
jgi:hypothetical protein